MTSLISFNPYLAGISGKSGTEAAALEHRIETLAPAIRDFLFASDLPEKLETAMRSARLPEQYFVATSKIVFLVILGDIPVTAAEQLLARLGVPAEIATNVARLLDDIFRPLIEVRAAEPLTQHSVPANAPQPSGPQPVGRNILNLRDNPHT